MVISQITAVHVMPLHICYPPIFTNELINPIDYVTVDKDFMSSIVKCLLICPIYRTLGETYVQTLSC